MPNSLLTYLSLGNFLLKARKNFGVNHADVVYERGSYLCLFPTSRWDRKKSQSYTKAYLSVYVVQKSILYMPILDHSKGKGRLLS